jgi:hypothetical protein
MVIPMLLGAALAAAPPRAEPTPLSDPGRWSVGLPAEVDLVGLAFGVHPEALWRPFAPDGAIHLRAATGFMGGPELSLVPVSAGVRVIAFPRRRVRPGLGTGLQLQTFFPHQHAPVVRLDQTIELTLDVRVVEAWRVGMQLSPEFGLAPGFGLGMAARLGVQRDLPW